MIEIAKVLSEMTTPTEFEHIISEFPTKTITYVIMHTKRKELLLFIESWGKYTKANNNK